MANLIKSLSYKAEDQPVLEELHKIALREDRSDSFIMMEAMREYAKAHAKGNDSYQLDQFRDGLVAYPTPWKPVSFDDLKGCSWKDDDDMVKRLESAISTLKKDRQAKRDSEIRAKGISLR